MKGRDRGRGVMKMTIAKEKTAQVKCLFNKRDA